MLQVDSATPLHHRVVPAGATDLVLSSGGSWDLADTGERYFEGPGVFVAGPSAGLLPLCSAGAVRMIGLRLANGCASSLLRLPLSELASRCVPLDLCRESRLEKEKVRTLTERLCEVRKPEEHLVHVNQFLLSLAASARAPEDLVQQALSAIRVTHGQLRVDALASRLGVTSRHLERGFRQHVGLSPKALCRLERFHHVRSLVAGAGRPVWSQLACESGYYDQAHLIAEFRHFTGQTPATYRADQEVGFFLYGPERQP